MQQLQQKQCIYHVAGLLVDADFLWSPSKAASIRHHPQCVPHLHPGQHDKGTPLQPTDRHSCAQPQWGRLVLCAWQP